MSHKTSATPPPRYDPSLPGNQQSHQRENKEIFKTAKTALLQSPQRIILAQILSLELLRRTSPRDHWVFAHPPSLNSSPRRAHHHYQNSRRPNSSLRPLAPSQLIGTMENLHNELWLKGPSNFIQEFSGEAPVPQFVQQPGYKFQLQRAGIDNFPLIGVSPRMKAWKYQKLETTSVLPCGGKSILVRPEYIQIERELEHVAARKWTQTNPRTGAILPEAKRDYKVSGQPGSGV